MAAAKRNYDSERNEVRDMVKRLDVGELSSVLCKGSLDGEQNPLNKDALLQDMLGKAKTTVGHLFLTKKMLQLPTAAVKAFLLAQNKGLAFSTNGPWYARYIFLNFLQIHPMDLKSVIKVYLGISFERRF